MEDSPGNDESPGRKDQQGRTEPPHTSAAIAAMAVLAIGAIVASLNRGNKPVKAAPRDQEPAAAEQRASASEQPDPNTNPKPGRITIGDRWMISLTAAIVLTAFAGVGVTWFQGCVMQGQLLEMERQREGTQAVQRAFMSWNGIKATRMITRGPSSVERQLGFVATFQNNGTTPAIDVHPFFSADILDREPDGATFIGTRPPKSSGFTLAPNSTTDSGLVTKPEAAIVGNMFLVPPAKMNTIEPPKFYLWGWVIYRDIFPNSETHLLEFCKRLIRVGRFEGNDTVHWTYTNCSSHNCVDTTCLDYADIVKLAPKRPVAKQ